MQKLNYNNVADQGSLSLSNVTYTGVRGTSAVQNAITLNCAASTNCTNIRMSHVNITSWASGTHQVSFNGTSSCTTPAVPCLHHDCLGLRYGEDEDFVF